MKPSRIHVYVSLIVAAAAAAGFIVYVGTGAFSTQQAQAVLCFSALAVLSHLLSHRVREGTVGSMASIPYLAAAIVSPNVATVLAVTIASLVVETSRRKGVLKSAFNTAQFSLATSVAVLAYLSLGGVSLLSTRSFEFLPYGGIVVAFVLVNTMAVSGVIALNENRNVLQVWRQVTGGALLYDLFASPMAFIFAWTYASYGPVWTIGLALPLLAVRQTYKTNWQLEQNNQELLQLMVKAIEARDPYTSGHSRRVAHYSKIIARALGMNAKHVERVGVAALLHDVGKIHEVFAPILRKPDRLTPEERAIMETHPIKSAELVQNVSQLRDVIEPIRHHHENWDGSGYPAGLAGQDIPLFSRIIIFADTIDAMTSDRPYRKAMGEAEVRAELIKWRGRQFDPDICDILLSSPLYVLLFKPNHQTPVVEYAIAPKRSRSLVRAQRQA